MNEWHVLSLLEEWDRIRPELWELMSAAGFDAKQTTAFLVAVEEMYVNISYYAYPGENPGDVLVSAEEIGGARKGVRVRLTDHGIPFDPTGLETPKPAGSAAGLKRGGWGIFLARERCDVFRYRREGNRNILTMVKYLGD